MSECVVRMEMPRVCITDNGFYGYCPMDRVWCIQRNAPPDITMREAYEAMTDKIPSWCPILCQLPEGHGRLVDAELVKEILKPVDSISHYEPEWTWGELHESNCVAIDNAPTIVPAEAQRKVNASDAVAPTDTPTDTPTVPAERSET